jgi:hypothetical protein
MAAGILPAPDVRPVLENPLGWKVLADDITYPNPNRYFSHKLFHDWFNHVPVFLQSYFEPIDSVYLACAIAKTVTQFLLILFLAYLASVAYRNGKSWLLAMVIIIPFFQTNGYCRYIGIIDPSVTYTFFYAVPLLFTVVYFLPFFEMLISGKEPWYFRYIKWVWPFLALVVALSGPLNTGVSLVIALCTGLSLIIANNQAGSLWMRIKNLPSLVWIVLFPVTVFSVYSLFIARFNSVDEVHPHSVLDLYAKLPLGLWEVVTGKLAFPLLILLIVVNHLMLRKQENENGLTYAKLVQWCLLFSLFYMLLLPLGGYRDYRPHVIRYDTIMPVTLSLFFLVAYGTLQLFVMKPNKGTVLYSFYVILTLFIFMNADQSGFDKNACERNAFMQIARSDSEPVRIKERCTLLSWEIPENFDDTKQNAELLVRWRITPTPKRYYYAE